MRALLTTCTADKDPRPALLPARLRYQGARVDFAVQRAEAEAVPLLFLSGVFGIVSADLPIPWYDHALQSAEVDGHRRLVIGQLCDLGVTAIEALLAPEDTPGWAPYHRLLVAGCQGAGVMLQITLTPLR
ncbi:MAG: hypothetical protein ACI8RZ_001324 [Myxococcota bacterium]|jgi:hypothetical protein